MVNVTTSLFIDKSTVLRLALALRLINLPIGLKLSLEKWSDQLRDVFSIAKALSMWFSDNKGRFPFPF